ncbi:MAG: gliding motility-associated C-terminal domain-containing protein [Saprospiraceae bacterium]
MRYTILLLILVLCCFRASAQTEYHMSNLQVSDCEGILLDSDLGDVENTYDHNENYTFTICVPAMATIKLQFLSFCTEDEFDYMRFYDGPDTLSPQIGGNYTGTLGGFTITSNSGCLTINFISDANVVCTGWVANWTTTIPVPIPPVVQPLGAVPCMSTQITLKLDQKIFCDSIDVSDFIIVGPISPAVVAAIPIGCVNGMTDQIQLTLGSAVDKCANYTININLILFDICGRPHDFLVTAPFVVNDCPISVDLYLDTDPLCAGSCTNLIAEASGCSGVITYQWSPVASVADRVLVCSPGITNYSVTVSDNQGNTASASYTVVPAPKPIIWTGNDTTICQSIGSFYMPVNVPGGTWQAGAIHPDNADNGYFEPWRKAGQTDQVIYTSPAGCKDTILVTILPINQGNYDGSCTTGNPFQLSGGTPAGGTWSGSPYLSSSGLFTPTIAGTWWVTYTAPNGCMAGKQVQVWDSIAMPRDTFFCQEDKDFQIIPNPFGGKFSGPGITSVDWGWFRPSDANAGDNVIYYNANGCLDSMIINVAPITASNDIVVCPSAGIVTLDGAFPPGGMWSGSGIIDPLLGLFDPSIPGHGADQKLTYSVNGCKAFRIAYVRETKIYRDDPLTFCPEEDSIRLEWSSVQNDPWWGTWTGPGISVVNPSDPQWFLDPGKLTSGNYLLHYELNGCTDSIEVIVYPSPALTKHDYCGEDNPGFLTATIPGTTFAGPGIQNDQGFFDPLSAGPGTHTIELWSDEGCYATDTLVVTPKLNAEILGIESQYCYKDTIIVFNANPLGGTLTLDAQPIVVFNPATIGSGTHVLKYQVGTGKCADSEQLFVTIGNPLVATASFLSDTICFGSGINISAEASGGITFGNFVYTWDQGVGFGKAHFVTPKFPTEYIVSISDGCSDPAFDTVEVFVHQEIETDIIEGPKVCYNDSTFAQVTASPAGIYQFTWNTTPAFIGDTYEGLPGNHIIKVENLTTGCITETTAKLPGYPVVAANFSLSPNKDCISLIEPNLEYIDFSNGGVSGFWDFGDGTILTYTPGQQVVHQYLDTGNYIIKLYLENEGGCADSTSQSICVRQDKMIFVPDAFSPNNDGVNDIFQPQAFGVRDYELVIFNRYGGILFESKDIDTGWNGKVNGQLVQSGVYVYVMKYKTLYSDKEFFDSGSITVLY